MATVRCLALCVVISMLLAGCVADTGDAALTAGSGVTTTTPPPATTEPTTTTLLALPTTAPRPTEPSTPESTEAPTTTVVTTTTTRPAVLSGPIDYSITRGIAGVDRLTIAPDGSATFQSGLKNVNFVVPPPRLMELAAALHQADFATLEPVYGFAGAGFEYRVSYIGTAVLVFGSAAPSRLKAALGLLGQEMERGRAL